MVDEPDSGAVEDGTAPEEDVDSREDLDVRIDAMLEENLSKALPSLEHYCTEENLRVLTVLIGDQVGSSSITSEHINLEAKALRDQFRGIYEEICKDHKGIHVEYAGDEFLAVFSSPSNAVRCALALQAKYRDDSPFEVRIGLHDGEIVAVEEERTHRQATIMKEVFGREVNICARICGMSCAERILMSRSVFDKARANIPSKPKDASPELTWANWGGYFFNGVERNGEPEAYEVCEVYQTEHGPREAPGIKEKSRPKGHDDDIFGWRPGPDAPLPGTKWRLIQKLGEGGFGEVWLAQDKAGRQTVFKFCTKKSKLRSLRREYEVFNALVEEGKSPPGITEVIGAHDDRDGDKPPYYIQLEYCAGGDLRQWLAGPGKDVSRRIQLDVALQAVRAVERIHAKNCIHRDIKPSNFLLEAVTDPTRAPVLKICDFGIGQAVLETAIKHGDNSQDMHGGGGRFTLSTNELMRGAGTFLFIAPELVVRRESTPGKVSKQAEASADIYSLGVTLYQIFTGDPEAIPGPGLSGIADDPILTEDIAACLDPDPTQRPTAAELADRLERYDDRTRSRERNVQRARMKRLAGLSGLALIVAAVSIGLGGVAIRQSREAVHQQNIAVTERQRAEQMLDRIRKADYTANVRLAALQVQGGLGQVAWDYLTRSPEEYRHWEWGFLFAKSDDSIATFSGHTGRIADADFSPDATRLVTASYDGSVKVWDIESQDEILSLDGHEFHVSSVRFSPDGNRIATASWDRSVRLWDANSGAELSVLANLSGNMYAVAFSPDGAKVAAAGWDNIAHIWSVDSGEKLLRLEGHGKEILAVSFSPQGDRVLTASWDMTARIWDAVTGELRLVLDGHSLWLRSANFSPDGTRVVTGSHDRKVKIWCAREGINVATLEGHRGPVTDVAFSPDGQRIISASLDQTVRIWDAATSELLSVFRGHHDGIWSLAWSPTGQQFITTSNDRTAKLWRVEDAFTNPAVIDSPFARFKPDAKRMVAWGEHPVAVIVDTRTGESIVSLRGHHGNIWDADFQRNGDRVVSAGGDGHVRVWEADTTAPLYTLDGRSGLLTAAAISSDGTLVVAGANDGTLILWDLPSGCFTTLSNSHQDRVTSIRFCPIEKRFATSSRDRTTKLWASDTGELLHDLDGHYDYVLYAEFSPDGEQLVTTSSDRSGIIWDVQTGTRSGNLSGHFEEIGSAAFSPDGARIATGDTGGTVIIWDAADGELLLSIDASEAWISALQFSEDGMELLAWDGQGELHRWKAFAWWQEAWSSPHHLATLVDAACRLPPSWHQEEFLISKDDLAGIAQSLKMEVGVGLRMSLAASQHLPLFREAELDAIIVRINGRVPHDAKCFTEGIGLHSSSGTMSIQVVSRIGHQGMVLRLHAN